MAIDAATVQNIVAGVFAALSGLFLHKSGKRVDKGIEEINGHAEQNKIIRRRLIAHGKRIRELEESARESAERDRSSAVERRELQARIEALESRGS